jgi:hypothetical protein
MQRDNEGSVCTWKRKARSGSDVGLALENGGMEDNKRRHVEANQEEIEEYF